MLCDQFIERLALPERIVAGMLHHLHRPRQLLEPVQTRIRASGTGAAEGFVIVVGVALNRIARALLGRLLVGVIEIRLAEGAVVEPVVAHPAIHHRALRHGHLQRRMRIEQRHDDREALIGRTDHADAAVRFRRVLHQPVDGVVGIGDVIGCRRV